MNKKPSSVDRRDFMMLSTGAIAATLGFQSSEAEAATSDYGIVGQLAPDLKLDYWIDKDGKASTFSVFANRGKWVFLKCFQSWCPGCHSSGFPTLKAFSDEFWDHPQVAIAGIQTVFEGFGTNSQKQVRKLQIRYDLPITMGHDPGNPDGVKHPQTMRKYRTGGTPWLILINPQGRVVYNGFHADKTKLIAYVNDQLDKESKTAL